MLQTITSIAAATKPNFLFVLADDWGWGDTSAYRGGAKPTDGSEDITARFKFAMKIAEETGLVKKGDNVAFAYAWKGGVSSLTNFRIVKVGDDGRVVRVRDVARVELGSQDYTAYVEFDGSPSVAMAVYQQPGANALSVAAKVQSEMERLAKES